MASGESDARASPAPQLCPSCGRPLSDRDRHLRFKRPDVLVGLDLEGDGQRFWQVDDLMLDQEQGAFVRVLLPIHFDDGTSTTYGTWLTVSPEDWRRVTAAWWTPEYEMLGFSGLIANRIDTWDALWGRWCRAEVRDPEQIPYVVDSSDEVVAHALKASHQVTEPRSVGTTAGPGAV